MATPDVQELRTVSFQLAEGYDWDSWKMKLRRGDDPKIRATMEDEILLHEAGSAETLELEDTTMFQTDSRDRAADRDAEAYENQKSFRTGEQIKADDELFRENPRLIKLRQGIGTCGYCAWCDAAVSSPTSLNLDPLSDSSLGEHAGSAVHAPERLANIAGREWSTLPRPEGN